MKNVNAPEVDTILQQAAKVPGVEINGHSREALRQQFRLARKGATNAEGIPVDNPKKYYVG